MIKQVKHVFPLVVLMAGLAPNIGLGGLVGEPAPPLVVNEWIKGQPVEIKPGTNIYVVEIWNTPSLTCRAAITNLNDLQRRFKNNGVVVVGISDEPAEKIREFVQHDGTNIEYGIAADNRRQTSMSYMKPVGQRGIPYAFVVGTNGNLLWHGSPQRGLGEILDLITSGRYDAKRAEEMDLDWHQMGQYLALARQGNDRVGAAGRALLAARTNDVALLCDLAFQIATFPKLATRDFALAGEALDQAEKLAPTNAVPVGITRGILLFESGKQDEGLARATQALASAQSPMEKTNIQAIMLTMEKRRNAEEKKGDQGLTKTNAPLGKEPISPNAMIYPDSSNALINPNP
jgi:alkyl hydroperoxide reductase subunit AhpC